MGKLKGYPFAKFPQVNLSGYPVSKDPRASPAGISKVLPGTRLPGTPGYLNGYPFAEYPQVFYHSPTRQTGIPTGYPDLFVDRVQLYLLLPCLLWLLPTVVHHGFPFTRPGSTPPALVPYIGFSFTSPLAPPPPCSWAPPTADARRCLFCCAASWLQLTMNRLPASRTPGYLFPAIIAAVNPQCGQRFKNQMRSVDSSVGRNCLRSSTMHLCQVLRLMSATSRVLPTNRCSERDPTG